MTRSRTLLPALIGATALVFTAALPAVADHRPGATVYKADLQEVVDNDTDGTPSGTVTIVRKGDQIRVNLEAEGLDDGVHISHVHGGEGDNTCPTEDADTNDDGLVDLGEGVPVYGGIVETLGGGEDVGTEVEFSRTFDAPDADLEDLHIVLHGVDLDQDGMIAAPFATEDLAADEGTMPALCGEIVKISN